MNIVNLQSEITHDPLTLGYSDMDGDALWASLTDPTRTAIVSNPVTELGILGKFAETDATAGEACLQKLEFAASTNALIKRVISWTKPGAPGIDFGLPSVRGVLDMLHAAGVLTDLEVSTLKSLGEKQISRLEEIECGDLTREYFDYLRGTFT